MQIKTLLKLKNVCLFHFHRHLLYIYINANIYRLYMYILKKCDQNTHAVNTFNKC